MRFSRTAAAATALLTLALCAGCRGRSDDKKAEAQETETVTATPPASASSSVPATHDQVEGALLMPGGMGIGYVAGNYTNTEDPSPCNPTAAPVDEQAPPQAQAGTQINHSSIPFAFREEIKIYASDEEAADAFTVGTDGLNCTVGRTPYGTKIKIDPPQDVSSTVEPNGSATSKAYTFTVGAYEGSVVMTLAHRVIMVLTTQEATAADTSSLPDPVDFATAAWIHVIFVLGAFAN